MHLLQNGKNDLLKPFFGKNISKKSELAEFILSSIYVDPKIFRNQISRLAATERQRKQIRGQQKGNKISKTSFSGTYAFSRTFY